MPPHWYVVQTKPAAEARVSQAIAELEIQDCFLPMEEREISHANRKSIVTRPLYPSYVFASFDVDADPWPRIVRTPGVQTILGLRLSLGVPTAAGRPGPAPMARPLPLPDHVVPALRAAAAASNGVFKIAKPPKLERLKPNDPVQITDGPLAGLRGLVAYDRRQRVGVLLDMLRNIDAISVPREFVAVIVEGAGI